jgi:hypothetical protein
LVGFKVIFYPFFIQEAKPHCLYPEPSLFLHVSLTLSSSSVSTTTTTTQRCTTTQK